MGGNDNGAIERNRCLADQHLRLAPGAPQLGDGLGLQIGEKEEAGKGCKRVCGS